MWKVVLVVSVALWVWKTGHVYPILLLYLLRPKEQPAKPEHDEDDKNAMVID
jgi:hypothetical protein